MRKRKKGSREAVVVAWIIALVFFLVVLFGYPRITEAKDTLYNFLGIGKSDICELTGGDLRSYQKRLMKETQFTEFHKLFLEFRACFPDKDLDHPDFVPLAVRAEGVYLSQIKNKNPSDDKLIEYYELFQKHLPNVVIKLSETTLLKIESKYKTLAVESKAKAEKATVESEKKQYEENMTELYFKAIDANQRIINKAPNTEEAANALLRNIEIYSALDKSDEADEERAKCMADPICSQKLKV